MSVNHNDANAFAEVLKSTELKNQNLCIGSFKLHGMNYVESIIQYNNEEFELLENRHDYTFEILDGRLELSVQLYENVSNHYRLFSYTKFNDKVGMVFSINLTTEKESENVIFLTQKIKFSERYDGDANIAKAHRRQKQLVFTEYLRKLGFDVTENNDVILGIFDPANKKFANTTAEQFINDFILISLLKGHFQGNKGYQLEILPSFRMEKDLPLPSDNVMAREVPNKVSSIKKSRTIPLSLRYKVLRNDAYKCVACGRSPGDGIKLHVDHKIPYSLGGLTEVSNLQTLCNECNIGKSNRYIDK